MKVVSKKMRNHYVKEGHAQNYEDCINICSFIQKIRNWDMTIMHKWLHYCLEPIYYVQIFVAIKFNLIVISFKFLFHYIEFIILITGYKYSFQYKMLKVKSIKDDTPQHVIDKIY